MRNPVVPEPQRSQINGQKPIPADLVRSRIREVHQGDNHHRIQTHITEFHIPGHPHHRHSEQHPGPAADQDLDEKSADRSAHRSCRIHHQPQAKDSQQVSHRVVTPALELQDRSQVVLEFQALRSQDREDGRRVGRRHDGTQQQALEQRKTGYHPVYEQSGENRRQQHTDGRQHHPLPHHRTDTPPLGVQTPGKQNEVQSDHPDELSDGRAVEIDPPDAVAPGQHTDGQKQNQGRYAETISPLPGQDADEKQHRTDQNNITCCDVHKRLGNCTELSFCWLRLPPRRPAICEPCLATG